MRSRTPLPDAAPAEIPSGESRFVQPAHFWEPLSEGKLRCLLCPHACLLPAGHTGRCGVRQNRAGALYTLVHSRVCAAHVDPIEKKPLFHFLPGSTALSIATAGCNVNCRFCQNARIAHPAGDAIPGTFASPELIVQLARKHQSPTIAFTYTEPTIFAEFLMDTAQTARAAGLHTVAISNGFIQSEPLRQVFGQLDAVKIDLKAFDAKFYRQVVGARLEAVLETLLALRSMGKWLEIVTLLIPTLNDGAAEVRQMAQWIAAHLGPDVPLHFSRFHPDHQMLDLPPTPTETLEHARQIALAEGLRYVYIGNLPGHTGQNTHCPHCQQLLVERVGFTATRNLLTAGDSCPNCGQSIAGFWQNGSQME